MYIVCSSSPARQVMMEKSKEKAKENGLMGCFILYWNDW